MRLILGYLETHKDVSTREARRLLGWGVDGARELLWDLARVGMLKRNHKDGRGLQHFTRGREFDRWPEWEAGGFQPPRRVISPDGELRTPPGIDERLIGCRVPETTPDDIADSGQEVELDLPEEIAEPLGNQPEDMYYEK